MTASDLVRLLAETNLALAAGLIVVIAARRWVRRLFGASAAYGLWLLPALAALATALPPRTVEIEGQRVEASASPIAALPELPVPALEGAALDLATVALWGWIAGAVAMGLWLAARQLQFMREVERGRAGPAVVGFLRPRIVLPADFETRFSRREQLVVQAHERTHLLRGDAQVNGVVALVRCLCWFNPLAHVGAHLLRVDQELACDANVIARHPTSRAPYALALLKAELAARPLPLGCYWPARAIHPLTERMAMLQRDSMPRHRRLVGAAGVGVLATATSMAAWAAQPPHVVASVAAPRSAASGPAGERAFRLIEPPRAQGLLAHLVQTPGLASVAASGSQEAAGAARIVPDREAGAALRDVSHPADVAGPSPDPEVDAPRIVLANVQPTTTFGPRLRPTPSNADLPSWSETPTMAEMLAAYPAGAAKANYASSATLECSVAADGSLTDCVAASEGAPGFGSAALKLAPKFRLPTTSPSGASMVGRTVRFPLHWINPSTATARLSVPDAPPGVVAFNCRVRTRGAVDNCVIVDARPQTRQAFNSAGEAVLRFKAPRTAAEFSRIRVIVFTSFNPPPPSTSGQVYYDGDT